jgi:hypothetical protein
MIFHIYSFQSAGPIKLGMNHQEVQKILSVEVQTFKKNIYSTGLTCTFSDLGVQVHYKSSGECEAIEFFPPASPIFQGQYLLKKPFRHLEQWIKSQDESAEFDGTGIKSEKLGIGIYAPFGKEKPYEPPEGVIVFEKGYYE